MSMPCPCLSETIRSDRVLARSISHGDQIIHRRTPSQDQTRMQNKVNSDMILNKSSPNMIRLSEFDRRSLQSTLVSF